MKVNDFLYNIYYFSKDDLKLFEKFLSSPYFNTLQYTASVFRIIKKNLSYIPQKKYEELKSIIIQETGYSEATVRKILSYLNEMYIEYVQMQAFRNDEFYKEYLCCNYMLLKGNYKYLDKRIKIIDKYLSDSKCFDDDLFIKLFETNILNYNIISTSEDILNPISKLSKQKEYTLESSKNLMVYTLSKTTIGLVNYVIQCNDSNNKSDNKYPINLEKLFSIIKSPEYDTYNKLQKTTINLFYKTYKLFSNILNDKYYDDYKDYYNEVKHLYNIEFCKTHLSILLNYCFLRQRMKDKTKFYTPEALSILFEYIDNEFYKNKETKYLHPLMYRNFITNCFNADRKDVLLKFINNHTGKLHPSEIELMKIFGMSHYYYLIGEYRSSIKNIELLSNPKFLYRYDIYNLTIKNYYELQDYINIENILHNYNEHIIKDSFLTKYDKERYNYFVVCMKRYLIAYYKYGKKKNIVDFEYLLKKISIKDSFVMKNWLKEKVSDFISMHYKTYSKKRFEKN